MSTLTTASHCGDYPADLDDHHASRLAEVAQMSRLSSRLGIFHPRIVGPGAYTGINVFHFRDLVDVNDLHQQHRRHLQAREVHRKTSWISVTNVGTRTCHVPLNRLGEHQAREPGR